MKAGSFCSSLLLLRLKREELCLLSFLTGVWDPGCFPFSSWVVGGALLLAFLVEFCGNRGNVNAYIWGAGMERWPRPPRLSCFTQPLRRCLDERDSLVSSATNPIFMLNVIECVAAASTCLLGINMPPSPVGVEPAAPVAAAGRRHWEPLGN